MSIGFKPDLSLEQIANRNWEALDSPTVAALAQLAGRHYICVVCPTDRRARDRRFNSVVLLDRRGQIACRIWGRSW